MIVFSVELVFEDAPEYRREAPTSRTGGPKGAGKATALRKLLQRITDSSGTLQWRAGNINKPRATIGGRSPATGAVVKLSSV